MYKICNNQCIVNYKNRLLVNQVFVKQFNKSVEPIELDPAYSPHKIANVGKDNNYFKSRTKNEKPFSMILPPPNVTGTLHLGHALTVTIQDILVRWKQMQGIETMWIPGIDHAGIATQVVVEKHMWKEKGKTRHDVGRPGFLEEVWRWKRDKGNVIGDELRRLGACLNWETEIFTLDPRHTKAVEQAFIKLFDAGLIYRGDYLVNWSCVLRSAISDIEVDHLEITEPRNISIPGYEKPIEFGKLFRFAYKVDEQEEEEIVVATTRPETMLGDVAVAVHQDDTRYSKFVGRHLWHPFRQERIPVISDPCVDPEFGTGAVKITPAHDQVDFEIGKRHSLKSLKVINESGNISSLCSEFEDLPRFEAREKIINRLNTMGLFRGSGNHKMTLPLCSRSRDVVELMVIPQWFLKCDEMASKALNAVNIGKLTIQPKVFEKNWSNWLQNIRDWCISRQVWWGHEIPAYFCINQYDPKKNVWVAAENVEQAKTKAARKLGISESGLSVIKDKDVLDTWFSSSLLPFTVFGWPDMCMDHTKHYPLSLMETGHDILFFWVARMVMLGLQLTDRLPFNAILLHGVICDVHGRKMSKSLGNVVAPEDVMSGISLEYMEKRSKESYASGLLSSEELKRAIQGQRKMFPQGIPECGLDALRFTLVSHNIKCHYINFDVSECHTNRLFCNKIWQATKFTKMWFKTVSSIQNLPEIKQNQLSIMDRWILSRLSKLVLTATRALQFQDLHIAVAALKNFLYYDFCDVYLESTKRGLRSTESTIAGAHCWVLLKCLDVALRTLAPFMPNLSAHLHHSLPIYPGEQKFFDYPSVLPWTNDQLERDVEEILDIITGLRRLKKIFNITGKHKPEAFVLSNWDLLETMSDVVTDLSGCHSIRISEKFDNSTLSSCVQDCVRKTEIFLKVPDETRKNIQLDMPNMQRKREKLLCELEKMKHRISFDKYKVKASLLSQEAHAKKIIALEEKIARIDYISNLIQR